jgi:hypothetical protein
LGPFSSSLLPLLEAADTFGCVVMAAVVLVVAIIVVDGGRGRLSSLWMIEPMLLLAAVLEVTTGTVWWS